MTKNEPKEKRLKEIIEAAVKEFITKGYEGASMESIARASGLTKGGLYHHFSSKDEILLAANNIYFEPVLEMMEKARRDKSPSWGLKTFIIAILNHWKTHEKELIFTFLSWSKILSDRGLWPITDQYIEQMLPFYEEMFRKGINSGEFREHNTHSRAITLMSALDGISAYITMSDILQVKKTAEHLTSVLIDELVKKEV